jgi:transcriptional regulator with XRE-family HTH domain
MATKDPRIVGPRIAKARQARGLTQIELAQELGVSPSTVANWERGASFPQRKLGKIEKFFGEPFDYDEGSTAASLDIVMDKMDELQRYMRDQSLGKGGRTDDDVRRAV